MVTVEEEYPKSWNFIKNKKISQEKIENFFIDFIKRIVKEIKEGKKDDLDIGDAFQLYIFAVDKGYKFSKQLERFLINLGDYKLEHKGKYIMPLNSITEVESELDSFKS